MEKILVPLDFSTHSLHALDLACKLARKSSEKVHILHVVEHPSDSTFSTMGVQNYDPMENVYILKLMEVSKEKLEKLIMDPQYEGVAMEFEITVGAPYSEISDHVEKGDFDIIVMGTHGTTGVEEVFIGSNAERVVRHAFCPVITVKNSEFDHDIKKIVFASHFKNISEAFVSRLKELQKFFDATLHLVKINTPNNFSSTRNDRKIINEFAEMHSLENYEINIYNALTEETGIISFAHDIDADLIAMGTHGRTGIAHLLVGSIAEDIVNHAEKPVWTFRI